MLVTIDIDDTLCQTTLRWIQLFQEKFGNPEQLTPAEMIEKYEIVQRVPYRQSRTATELLKTLISNDASWIDLLPYPEAATSIAQLQEHVEIAYLTSRTEIHRPVTEDRLEKYGFPPAPVIMRPNVNDEFSEASAQFSWKSQYLLQHTTDISTIIDNSKSLAKELSTANYTGHHILYGHTTIPTHTKYHIFSWNEVNVQYILDTLPA